MKGNVSFTCEVCGKSYFRHNSWIGKTHTCSRGCANERMRRKIDDVEIARLYQGGMSTEEVGETFGVSGKTIVKRLMMQGVTIRSRTSHLWTDKNPTRGKGHSKEVRERLSKMAHQQFSDPNARALASHNQCVYLAKNLVSSVSGVENKVASELDRMGIQYQRQVPIRDPMTGKFGACVDFMVNGVALEVNGTFWHCDRRVYPDGPRNDTQWRTAKAYARKVALLKRLGIRIVEVWEKDIRENLSCAVEKALEGCRG